MPPAPCRWPPASVLNEGTRLPPSGDPPMRLLASLLGALVFAFPAAAAEKSASTAVQQDILRHLDAAQAELIAVNQDIWTYAELGLQEYRSAARLVGLLKKAGFRIREGVSGMPTAFIAEYGSGQPV